MFHALEASDGLLQKRSKIMLLSAASLSGGGGSRLVEQDHGKQESLHHWCIGRRQDFVGKGHSDYSIRLIYPILIPMLYVSAEDLDA